MAVESVGKTFVTVCVFLGLIALLVSSAVTIIGNSDLASNEQSVIASQKMKNTFSVQQMAHITQTYVLLDPYVEVIENASHGSFWYPNSMGVAIWDGANSGILTFHDTSNILVYLVIETEVNAVTHVVTHPVKMYFHQVWGGFLGLFVSQTYAVLDVDRVVGNIDLSDGISYTDVTLKEGYTLIITPDPGTDLRTDWNTHSQFSVSIGQTLTNASDMSSGDVLAVIGQVMTFSVPNAPLVNLILMIVLVPTYTIMIVFFVRSFIPFLP